MGVGAALAGLSLPALGVAIMLGISVIPPTVGLARRFLLSVLLLVAVLLSLLATWNLARVVLSPGPALAGVIAVVGGASVAYGRGGFRPVFKPGDLIAIALGGISLTMLSGWSREVSVGEVMSALSIGGDNANHANLARAVKEVGGFYYGADVGLLPGFEAYPAGLASLTAYLGAWLAGGGGFLDGAGTVRSVALALYVGHALVVVFAVLAAGGMAYRASGSLLSPICAGIVVFFGVQFGPQIVSVIWGFQAQLAATAGLLALLWLVDVEELARHPRRLIVLVGCGVLAIAYLWYLLVPIALALAISVAWRHRSELNAVTVGLVGLAALLSLVPILNGPNPADHVNIEASVLPLPWYAYVPVIVAGIASLNWLRRRNASVTSSFLVLGAAVIAFTVALMTYQRATVGGISYFVPKLWYVVQLVGLVFTAASIGVAVDPPPAFTMPLAKRAIGLVAGVALVFLSAWAIGSDLSTFSLRHPVGPVESGLADRLVERYDSGDLGLGEDVLVLAQCSWPASVSTTQWSGAILLSWGPSRLGAWNRLRRGEDHPGVVVDYAAAEGSKTIEGWVREGCVKESLPSADGLRVVWRIES
jgi:hypothetical protein